VLRFALIFVPLLTVSAAVVGGLFASRDRNERRLREYQEQEDVKLLSEIVANDFKFVVADVKMLTEGGTLAALVQNPQPASRQALARDFRLFLQHKRLYDQVRYLDLNGKEIVRVNYRGGDIEVVPDERLQLKHDRYYVAESLRLPPGEVFVSPMDLNIEEGQIEQPPKPTIRFGAAVFDEAGRRQGIVVLNYLAAKLLDKLHRRFSGVERKIQVLNAAGYWLAGPTPAHEWGFMFPDRPERSFAGEFRDEWRLVHDAAAGQFRTATGFYTFQTVYPLRALLGEPSAADIPTAKSNYHWKLISHTSADQLAADSREFWTSLWYTWLALGLVLAVVSWLFARLSVDHQRAREQLLQRERLAAIGEAMAALAHESRNALQRSRAGLEMLTKRVAGNQEAAELLGEVQEAQQYLTELYEEARGYAAPINLRRQRTDLRELVEKTWQQLLEQRPNSTARLIAGKPALGSPDQPATSLEDAHSDVDPRAMGQVLRNLLENAVAAADPAIVEVGFRETRLRGQPAVSVFIRDNGPGVPVAERARIFEPFYTTKVRGTGLGLAISRRIVAAHGGEIELVDSAQHGAEFSIVLPRSVS
jgi:signal transduction histidine kinase